MNNENEALDPKLTEIINGLWDSLSDEQKEKVKMCKDMDEIMSFAGKEGIELPDELLDAVAGGYVYKYVPLHGSVKWKVLNDETLEEMHEEDWHMKAAEWAEANGQSPNIISDWQLEQLKKQKDKC